MITIKQSFSNPCRLYTIQSSDHKCLSALHLCVWEVEASGNIYSGTIVIFSYNCNILINLELEICAITLKYPKVR